jgi:hypothetical protein
MACAKRDLVLTLLVIPMVLDCLCIGQDKAPEVAQSQPPAYFYGLTLAFSQDSAEPPGSSEFKNCLASHPPLACVPLTVALRKDGPETLVMWGPGGCGEIVPDIDFQQADGTWRAFPYSLGYVSHRLCNVIGFAQRFSRGESRIGRFRLASLGLDVVYPPPDDEFIHPRCVGCGWLRDAGPHLVRARLYLKACVASKKLKPTGPFNSFDTRSICKAGKEPTLLELISNEISLH